MRFLVTFNRRDRPFETFFIHVQYVYVLDEFLFKVMHYCIQKARSFVRVDTERCHIKVSTTFLRTLRLGRHVLAHHVSTFSAIQKNYPTKTVTVR